MTSKKTPVLLFQVFCSGEGLRSGILGKDIRSFIDTRKAGPGELSRHCVGPRGKTAYCELNDHQDGTFTLNLKPQVSSRLPITHAPYQLALRYLYRRRESISYPFNTAPFMSKALLSR
jgi:hypothetical protein